MCIRDSGEREEHARGAIRIPSQIGNCQRVDGRAQIDSAAGLQGDAARDVAGAAKQRPAVHRDRRAAQAAIHHQIAPAHQRCASVGIGAIQRQSASTRLREGGGDTAEIALSLIHI